MIITFDKELELRHSKNENRSKWLHGQILEEIQNPKFFQNFIVYYLFLVILTSFFFYFTYL